MNSNPEKTEPMKNPIIPIIALFILIVLGVAGYQVFKIFLVRDVGKSTEKPAKAGEADTGNVFKDLAINHPKNIAKRRGKQQLRQSYNAAPYPHNVQLGNKLAKIRLTIFTDIACGRCRQEVAQTLKNVPLEDVHVVFKHAPTSEDDIRSGIFEQIARREGVLPEFQRIINAAGGDISNDMLLRTLSGLGVSYRQQQAMLKDEPGSITRDLDKDLNQGDRAGISQLPTFFLNRYRMGAKTLPVENIRQYIDDIKASRPVYAVGG